MHDATPNPHHCACRGMPCYYSFCSVRSIAREAWPPKQEETFSTVVAKTPLTKPFHEQLSFLKEMAICESLYICEQQLLHKTYFLESELRGGWVGLKKLSRVRI